MPLYFAYGSNMDREAMRLRCPNSRSLSRARLARHKFFIMSSGYASVKQDPRADVRGVLYDLALSDVPALDRYEELGRGLYSKVTQPVLRDEGAPVRALVYIGRSQIEGTPSSAYLAAVIAAARDWSLPETYITYLASFGCGAVDPGKSTPSRRRAIQLKGL
jgi:cation transport regulator ChaC